MVVSDDDLRAAIIDALGQDARSARQLAEELAAGRPDRGPTPEELEDLLDDDLAFTRTTAGYFYVPAMVEGITWTVPVDDGDAAVDHLRAEPWLGPITWWMITERTELADPPADAATLEVHGHWDDEAGAEIDVVCGPEGWLSALAGETATLSVRDHRVHLAPCAEPPEPTAEQLAAIRAALDRATADRPTDAALTGRPIDRRFASISTVVAEALATSRSVFVDAPVPTLPALIDRAGLDLDDNSVAAAGFDWATLRQWQAVNRLKLMHDLDQNRAELVASLVRAVQLAAGGDADALGTSDAERRGAAELFADALDDGAIADGFWSELERRGTVAAAEPFAAALALRGDPDSSLGTAWLQSRVLDRAGDGAKAVAVLEGHLAGSASHRPALVDLAGFAADRSDLATAHRLLGLARTAADDRDLGYPGELLADEIDGYRKLQPRKTARRNDPCPCGSGRKYKVCHAGRDLLAFEDRAAWLHDKAVRHLLATTPELPWALAQTIAGPYDDPVAVDRWYDSPIVADLALHEGGGFAAFAAARRDLLPADEAELVDAWLRTDRGLFEVLAAADGVVDLYDVNRDDRCQVVNVHAAEELPQPGLLLGRPLPVGPALRAFAGFLAVPYALARDMSDALADGSADAVAGAIAEVVPFA